MAPTVRDGGAKVRRDALAVGARGGVGFGEVGQSGAECAPQVAVAVRHGNGYVKFELVYRVIRERGVQGRIVLITGGAKRAGAAISRRLHGAGARM